jgi:hypothetical protein
VLSIGGRTVAVVIVSVAVCPCPPLLVPQVAAGAAVELDDLRAACDRAVSALLGAGPDVVVLLGGGDETVAVGAGDSGSLAGFGVDLTVPLGARLCTGSALLPLSLTLGAWLLARSGWSGEVQGLCVAADTASAACAEPAAELRGLAGRVALLVLADGSAKRSPKAPGALDPRAEAFDRALAEALATPDPTVLAGLEEERAAALWVGGRAALAVLGHATAGEQWHADLLHDAAPYGVAYLVATWRRR